MAIDFIHDLQQVFRKILQSMSQPGTISLLPSLTEGETTNECFSSTWLTALTLLDAEVTYIILPAQKEAFIKRVSSYTLAKQTTIEKADYIICLEGYKEEEVLAAMERCKSGTFIDPHQSATWIMEVACLTSKEEEVLTGPGIRTKTAFSSGLSSKILQARRTKTKEFPLGIDIILTDKLGHIASIPRTTDMQKRGREEKEWAM